MLIKTIKFIQKLVRRSILLFLVSFPLAAAPLAFEVTAEISLDLFENGGSNSFRIAVVEGGVETIILNPVAGSSFTFNPTKDGDSVELTMVTETWSGPSGSIDDRGFARAGGTLSVDVYDSATPARAFLEGPLGDLDYDLVADIEGETTGSDVYLTVQSSTSKYTKLGFELTDSDSIFMDTVFGDSVNGVDTGTFGGPFNASSQESQELSRIFLGSDPILDPDTFGSARTARLEGTNTSEAFSSTGYGSTTLGFELYSTVVPVPAAVWLFGSCLGLLGWMRRKATV